MIKLVCIAWCFYKVLQTKNTCQPKEFNHTGLQFPVWCWNMSSAEGNISRLIQSLTPPPILLHLCFCFVTQVVISRQQLPLMKIIYLLLCVFDTFCRPFKQFNTLNGYACILMWFIHFIQWHNKVELHVRHIHCGWLMKANNNRLVGSFQFK